MDGGNAAGPAQTRSRQAGSDRQKEAHSPAVADSEAAEASAAGVERAAVEEWAALAPVAVRPAAWREVVVQEVLRPEGPQSLRGEPELRHETVLPEPRPAPVEWLPRAPSSG